MIVFQLYLKIENAIVNLKIECVFINNSKYFFPQYWFNSICASAKNVCKKYSGLPKKICKLILAYQQDRAWNSPNRGAFLMMRGLCIQNKNVDGPKSLYYPSLLFWRLSLMDHAHAPKTLVLFLLLNSTYYTIILINTIWVQVKTRIVN